MVPLDHVERDPQPVEDAVVQIAQADIEAAGAPPRGEIDLLPLVLVVVLVVLVALVVVVLVVVVLAVPAVRAVKLVRERHAVAALLEGEPAAGEEAVVVVADPGVRVRQLGRGVGDPSLRGVVVAGPPHAAAAPDADVALGVLHADVDAGLSVGAPPVGADLRARTGEQRLAQALLGRDDVDEAADGVRPVEQRGRAPHDLDPLRAVGVDRDAVVTRLAGEVARAHPVLEDEHAVSVEAADHRAARAGAEGPAGDARLVLQRVAQAGLALLDDVERVERRHRVERLERRLRAAGGRCDRHVLVHRGQGQLEVDRSDLTRGDRYRLPGSGEVLPLREHGVGTGRQVPDLERALRTGHSNRAGPDDQDLRTVHRAGVADQRHRPPQRARLLRPCRGSHNCDGRHGHRSQTLALPVHSQHRYLSSIRARGSPSFALNGPCRSRDAGRDRRRATASAGARGQTDIRSGAPGDPDTTGDSEREERRLGRRCASGEMQQVAAGDPCGAGSPSDRLGPVRRLELERAERCGDRLLAKLADRAVLIASVLLVPDGRRGRSTDQRNRQNGDPDAPAATP